MTRIRGRETGMQREADVIVVGARAAGAATSMLLARAGLSVLLLDASDPVRTLCPPTP